MKEEINEILLRITGSAALEVAPDATRRLNMMSGELEVYAVEKKDNQDGTFNLVYKARFASAVELEQSGQKIMGRDKLRKSQQLRGSIYGLQSELESEGDEMALAKDSEEFYTYFMDGIMRKDKEIYRLISND